MSTSRNLVVVRAGVSSLHRQWRNSDCVAREWDLVVSRYDGSPDNTPELLLLHHYRGAKLEGLLHLFNENPELLEIYDFFFLPDDDLLMAECDITRLFTLMNKYEVSLGQPSLTKDSFVSRHITVHNTFTSARFSNWVESMAPCFSKTALQNCLLSFGSNLTGWGVECLWSRLLETERIAVIDAVQARHTRPFGGPNHAHVSTRGGSALCEMIALFGRMDLRQPTIRLSGIVSLDDDVVFGDAFDPDDVRWLVSPW